MFKRLTNVLFDPKKQNQPWRQYAPNGKRRKVINMPFNGQISNIRAQGTKVIGVTPAAFSKSKHAHMAMYGFKPTAEFSAYKKPFFGTKPKPLYMYTAEERQQMSPEEIRIAATLQRKEMFENRYRKNSARRSTIRLVLDTIGEGRGISRELRGWSDLILGKKKFDLQREIEDRKQNLYRNQGLL